MEKNKLLERFAEIFGGGGEIKAYRSPGRVNLIGEHTDYNGGLCFPCALSLGICAAARVRDDKKLNLASGNFELRAECSLDEITYDKSHGWANYPKGVFSELLKTGAALSGFDIYFHGDLPVGAGLSSSASIEMLACFLINDALGLKMERIEMIKLCQRAENKFVGVNCGIMDQFAVASGKKNSAVLLDCRTLDYEYVPLELSGMSIVVGDTKYARGLADSKYNERRAECERAVALLQKHIKIDCLSDINEEQFEENKKYITSPVIIKRAKHVITENARARRAADSLKRGDFINFGELMNESHESLEFDYEVTGPHLDILSGEARIIPGCLGSRMTGAGFGGSTVSIVRNEALDGFIETVTEKYSAATGLTPEFYVAEAADGTGVLV